MKTLSARSTVLVIAGLALLGGFAWWYWASAKRPLLPYAGPVDKLTISTTLDAKSALIYLAQDKGYFRHNGLEVTLSIFPSGKTGCEQMLAGQVDIANFSDFVLVDQVFAGTESLRCVGAIAAADDHFLLAGKERGILAPSDLRGKNIAAPRGTSAEFFLGRFLDFNGLELTEVEVVDLNPVEMKDALAAGRVDAVMVWERWAEEIKKLQGDKIAVWPGQSGQKYYWLLATTDAWMQSRPAVLERMFKALNQAERFLQSHPEESIKIVAQWLGLNPFDVKAALTKSACALSFDQSLLITMEDEARWMIKNHLTYVAKVPNYLHYLEVGPLLKVDPKAVSLIIPRDANKRLPLDSGK